MERSIGTIKRWDKEVRGEIAELPTARLAIDRIQGLIPKALRAYEAALSSTTDIRVRKDAAKDILNNFKVLTDRLEIVADDREQPDSKLVAEAERLIAQAKGTVGAGQPGTETA